MAYQDQPATFGRRGVTGSAPASTPSSGFSAFSSPRTAESDQEFRRRSQLLVGDVSALLKSSGEEAQRGSGIAGDGINESTLLAYTASYQQAYVGVIQRMADSEFRSLTVGWIWGAFFFPFYWLLYRKMWPHAFLFLCLNTFGLFAMAQRPLVGYGMLIGMNVATAIMGKSLYIARGAKRLRAAKAVRGSLDQLTIGRLGGTSTLAVVLALILGFVAMFLIMGSVVAYVTAHPELMNAFPYR